MTSALVVGQGSIGQRHARILDELGLDVWLVSKRLEGAFRSVEHALTAARYDYVVIANETVSHWDTLGVLANSGHSGRVLIEKPLFERAFPLPRQSFSQVAVAYNLRFHPVLVRLKDFLAGRRVVSVSAYVGQYLPDWRPGTDHLASYSASRSRGGGVLRDLSHELDYLRWLFGPWQHLVAMGGRMSDLTVDSEDHVSVLAELAHGANLTLSLSYLDRIVRRVIVINCDDCTIEADLVRNTMTIGPDTETFSVERDQTYISQHKAMLSGEPSQICSLDEGMAVVETIAEIELSLKNRAWISK